MRRSADDKAKIAKRGAAWLPVLHLRRIGFDAARAARAQRSVLLLLRLTVLLCGLVMLGVVRIPAALVVAPRMVRVRSFRAGIGCGLRVLRSKRDQRRRGQQYDHQNLFHKMSPQREFPCNGEHTPKRGRV
jgi:hypothetical protein